MKVTKRVTLEDWCPNPACNRRVLNRLAHFEDGGLHFALWVRCRLCKREHWTADLVEMQQYQPGSLGQK